MTSFHGDPYRILGLLPGATETQVKSAYRRLVKKYHPDAAGDATIGRFLAVQAAYDALMDPATGRLRMRPRTTARWAPWDADLDRADATRRTYGRTGGASSEERGSQRSSSPGSAWDWARTAAGPDQGAAGPDRDPGGPGGQGTAGDQDAARGQRDRAPGGSRGQRDRHVSKARPGSTTYDGADRDPEPEWDGATWYGPSMGTYWTVNPKEYADPRKHGPEYQARAWRALTGALATRGRAAPPAPEPPPEPGAPSARRPTGQARGGLLGRILRGRPGEPRGDAE